MTQNKTVAKKPARKKPVRKKPVVKTQNLNGNKPNVSIEPKITEEMYSQFSVAEDALREKHKSVSHEDTHPAFVEQRPDGFDYVTEGYMRAKLNEHYPVWSWLPGGDNAIQFLGGEWVVVHGILEVYDKGVKRQFWSPGANRIHFKKGVEHSAVNVIDVDKNIGAANANAFKRAVNRLCNISDDIYRKRFSDPTLSKEEVKFLMELLIQIEDEELYNQVAEGIDSRRIHKDNVADTISYLKRKIDQIEKTKKEDITNE